jgi:hypothetical protein
MNRLDGDAVGPVKVLCFKSYCIRTTSSTSHPRRNRRRWRSQEDWSRGFGQHRRMAVIFHLLIMPDGYSVDLDQFHGLDQRLFMPGLSCESVAVFGKSLKGQSYISATAVASDVCTGACHRNPCPLPDRTYH